MKNLVSPLILAFSLLILSCGGSKNSQSTPDKNISSLVKKLNKNPDDAQVQNDLKYLYTQTVREHEDKISAYRNSSSTDRWDNILNEQNALQLLYNNISSSVTASRVVKPKSYFSDIQATSQEAAGYYYEEGKHYLELDGKDNSKQAYLAFQKGNQYVPGFRDAPRQMQIAFNLSVSNVVVNPIRDNEILFTAWNNAYNREYIQDKLVKDLGAQQNNSIPARFYTDRDARQQNVQADAMVDIGWRNIDIPALKTEYYTRSVSKQVESGRDSVGKTVYQIVYATLSITKRYFNATGNLDYKISDLAKKTDLANNNLTAQYTWQQESGTYSGDSRALSSSDWSIVNNANGVSLPGKDVVMNELMKNVYPELRNRIRSALSW